MKKIGGAKINDFWKISVVDGPVVVFFFVASGLALLFLLFRKLSWRWTVMASAALILGVLVAVLVWFVCVRVLNLFGMSLGTVTYMWLAAACGGSSVAIANLWDSRRARKAIAAGSILLFLITGSLGINAGFGLNRTLGSLFGISTETPIILTAPTQAPTPGPLAGPLWQTWVPPAGMPASGTTGSQIIPNPRSGFTSRPAGIYLPPAALVPNAPALPLVILLMGQPGNPDPQYVAATLDRDAALHGGLAPIVIVADQLGDPSIDPLCLDTATYGNAETFLTHDVVTWAKANLNIIQDHRYWTIAGFSNGGQCAISLAAKHPDLWSNVIDISGESFPGSEIQAATLKDIFGGDQKAYDAQRPVNLLAAHRYVDTVAIFTAGADDPGVLAGQRVVASAAQSAGMAVTLRDIPGGGHSVRALDGGLDIGFEVLYPRFGLSAPTTG
ncbi:alpha/beta hydrolase-fold protein [Cryobacterium sp. 10I1]|uniref:alpha/beta hydrolase n=1 Tax=unclassified Cryobacterium TaxID=2649013 RepID=UPI002B22CED6|nr:MULTISPECIES: alpha/beta hydrolase-fold protein [unclassified Cryobacterium]MEB0203169.1 alpha/beta hydrolase-fold protein [Cryobacterium sp. 5I3]MEB0304064.1 alpha/beta hydrolase-fold protein [Cryobacterium sp. 10I1]